jgi:hypothetical protein
MSQHNTGKATIRANRLLDYHIRMLTNKGINFKKDDVNYYLYSSESDDYIKIGYNKSKKLLSRTYNLEFISVINNIDFTKDFKVKLQFKGMKQIVGAKFVGSKDQKGYADFFNDEKLLDKVWNMARKIELAYVTIEYKRKTSKLEITVSPYPGAFLWVIFPPVFYDLKLKENEILILFNIIETLTEYVNVNLLPND